MDAAGSRGRMGWREANRAALATMVSASVAPYGYTVTLWSSGAMLLHFRGSPRPGEIWSFIAGAIVGFSVAGLIARAETQKSSPIESASARVVAGLLDWFAIGAAVGAAALLAQVHGWFAWPLASCAATAIYLVIASAQLATVALGEARRDEGP